MQEEKKSHGAQMNSVIRSLKLLEILKEYTDSEHKLTQNEVLEWMKKMDGHCTEKTLRADLRNLMAALNPVAEDYIEHKEQFRIVYDGIAEGRQRISGVNYVHEFSNSDLKLLIELVKNNAEIGEEQKVILENKLKALGSSHYQYDTDDIINIPQFSSIDKTCLKENLRIIKKAIAYNRKISFVFHGYDRDKKLTPIKKDKYVVSPYYVLLYGMKYYLLANTGTYENVSIYRLDLMKEIEILCEERKNIRMIKELEHTSLIEYMQKHPHMNYDRPVTVSLKVRKDKCNGYTALHDCFGEQYQVKRAIDETYDEVSVVCSEHFLIDWVIQFSDWVEVLRPLPIRKKIKEKALKLMEKYQ